MVIQQKANRNWLRQARIFAFESWWPPFWPHLEVDWDKALWTMKRLHLDTLQANALTKWACYPTQLVRRHPELGNRDLIQEAQDFCRKHGFRWIIYSLFGHAMPISTQLSKTVQAIYRPMIPDTSMQSNPGHRETVPKEFQDYFTQFHFGDERYVAHCPFAAESWLMDVVGELADRYDYDAAWLDGSISTCSSWVNDGLWNVCICPTCQKAYEKDFKRPMPIIKDLNDPRLLHIRQWIMKRLDDLLNKVAERFTKERKVPIVGNMSNPALATFHPQILRNLDGGLFEHAPDQVGLVRKVSEAKQLVDTAICYPDCYDPWPRKVTSGWEIENKGLTILAYGGTPYLAQPGKYYYDDSCDEPARKIFAFMEREQELLSKQEPYAYCVIPSLTEVVPSNILSFHYDCTRGWINSMLDNHIPLSGLPFYLLPEQKRIQKYPVLILAHMGVMSKQMLQEACNFVRDGGGLYIAYDPALLNHNFEETNDDSLQDIFDLKRESLSEKQLLRRHKFEGGRGGKEKARTYDVYLKINNSLEESFPIPRGKVQPSHFGHTVPGKSWTIVGDLVPTDEEEPLAPGIAFRKIGRGKVIFSSIAWGKQYCERRDPSLGEWMKEIVEWLGSKSLPIKVKGSRLVQLGTSIVDDGWLIYLVNTSNDFQAPRRNWREMMKVAERPLHVGPIEISVEGGKKAVAIYGSDPDEVRVDNGSLNIQYSDFQDHVVLYAH